MIFAPLIGWLPGPGGIPLFLIGLGLVATNHEWAERLLKDFDAKRTAFTDKYLMANPLVSRTIDIVMVITLIGGFYLAFTQDTLVTRGAGLACTSIGLLILLSNQKRFERIVESFKNRQK